MNPWLSNTLTNRPFLVHDFWPTKILTYHPAVVYQNLSLLTTLDQPHLDNTSYRRVPEWFLTNNPWATIASITLPFDNESHTFSLLATHEWPSGKVCLLQSGVRTLLCCRPLTNHYFVDSTFNRLWLELFSSQPQTYKKSRDCSFQRCTRTLLCWWPLIE